MEKHTIDYNQLAWRTLNRLDYEQYDRDLNRNSEADAHVVALGAAMALIAVLTAAGGLVWGASVVVEAWR